MVLLLLLLGLEYDADDVRAGLRLNWRAGLLDLVANFAARLRGGVAPRLGRARRVPPRRHHVRVVVGDHRELLGDLERYANRETPVVLAVLVFEDLAMAVFLPVAAAWLLGARPRM